MKAGRPSSRPRVQTSLSRGALWALTTLVLPSAAAEPARTSEAEPPLEKVVSHVGLSRLAFSRVNENDAKAAYRILIAELGKKLGYDLGTEFRLFDSPIEFAQAIRTGEVTFIILSTWDYLTMGLDDAVDIGFSAVSGGSFAHRWLLLVRRDTGIKTAADLKGRNVTLLHTNMASLGRPWIEAYLLEQRLGPPAQFFGVLETVTKASAAILPVFFGKAQACIVDQAAFNIMVEMNPQVGQLLEPVVQSEPLLNGIICLNRIGWKSAKTRNDMMRSLGELDREPAGRQILTLFRCEQLLPFEPAQFESVRRLFARHHQLQTSAKP